jgi:hypothetical protein
MMGRGDGGTGPYSLTTAAPMKRAVVMVHEMMILELVEVGK